MRHRLLPLLWRALVSFYVFTGSGVGTLINKRIMEHSAITNIFLTNTVLLMGVGLIALITLPRGRDQGMRKIL